ncbi:D-2-hydroxyacid dehydrogenase [Paramaledivibacter caminithermalis]|jgi:D-3-phosphoglycerate dehydrogenase|uniref:2-oxoglutarate reductase n=1 Tax=Paramaledivibacter caminithermalis (strain DSM 15212 / CIP 107654 / DViRD3) TaxID=1121301 RepID=A0A1M6SSY7_PARC5|nr:D-2-hydroxyacid dehydrogenase [Paramaledivibacter caminithermalis]SHK47799.1 D-3-phosphoglycerate dehydrogenase [Paramaledivibacter caminithermalis DSM 15212]
MIRILVTDGMDTGAVQRLIDEGFEVVEEHFELEDLKEKVKEFDAMVVRSATKVRKEVLDAALETKRLKLVVRAGVGVDNIDVNYALEHGIQVMNTPKASSASVAELAIAHMFALARHIHIANVTMREGKWNKKQYKGIELNGKTLGLIGFGRIARETAKKAHALGMKVIYTNRTGAKEGYDDFTYMPFDELLKNSDFISIHVPFNKEVGAVLGEEEFSKMKDGVYIINTARGGVISEKALMKALDSGKVAAAAVDVFEEEPTKNKALYTHPRVSLTPHIGASTKEAQARIGAEVVEVITKFFA